MIHILKNISWKEIYPILEDKNFVLVHADNVAKTTAVIKQWIAITLAKYYDKDPQKMIEAKQHFFQFRGCNLLNKNEYLLITNQNYEGSGKKNREEVGK